jgi:hypothetical protein
VRDSTSSRYITDQQRTAERLRALGEYARCNIQTADRLVCRHFEACRRSHPGAFYEGQLHHVGGHYDLSINDRPFRVMVVGQETGRPDRLVSFEARSGLVREVGYQWRFKADGKHAGRNPHMRGTTSLLRLLFGIALGTDHESEFITLVDGSRIHLYDAFALVNYLLCTATKGSSQGRSTTVMRRNCRSHFRAALEILEPTVVIIQGKSFWDSSIRQVFDRLDRHDENVFRGRAGSVTSWVAWFTHPSARAPSHWGATEPTGYLLQVVSPTVNRIRRLELGLT